jgi:predicted DNA-binding transcriptional regulator AlpA
VNEPVTPPPDPLGKPVISREEFAALLGVSDRTFRRWARHKSFPRPIRVAGRLLLWSGSAVRKFLDGR